MLYTNKKSNSIRAYILSLLLPLLSLIFTLKSWRFSWAKNAFWIICMYMGLIQIYQPEGTILGYGVDGGRYVLMLMDMYSNVNSFSEISDNFFDGQTLDVYCSTITYLVSRFTDNGHVLLLIFAIIFGYFYSRNVWYVLDRIPNSLNGGTWVFAAMLFLICPIWDINGVRMWTALHVFVYGAMPYFIEHKTKNVFWCFLSIIIHHSFIFPVAIFVLFIIFSSKLTRNKKVLTCLFAFYVFTLTLEQLNLESINGILQVYLPSYYEERIDMYVNEDSMVNKIEHYNEYSWHVIFFKSLEKWIVQIFILLSYL